MATTTKNAKSIKANKTEEGKASKPSKPSKPKKDKSITGARANVKGAGKNGKHATAPVRGSSTTYAPATPVGAKLAVKLGLDGDSTVSGRADDGSGHNKWCSHSITSIIRWMGHNGANAAEGAEWCKALGYTISPVTVNCQITSGRNGAKKGGTPGGFRGPLAELTEAQSKYLLSIRPTPTKSE